MKHLCRTLLFAALAFGLIVPAAQPVKADSVPVITSVTNNSAPHLTDPIAFGDQVTLSGTNLSSPGLAPSDMLVFDNSQHTDQCPPYERTSPFVIEWTDTKITFVDLCLGFVQDQTVVVKNSYGESTPFTLPIKIQPQIVVTPAEPVVATVPMDASIDFYQEVNYQGDRNTYYGHLAEMDSIVSTVTTDEWNNCVFDQLDQNSIPLPAGAHFTLPLTFKANPVTCVLGTYAGTMVLNNYNQIRQPVRIPFTFTVIEPTIKIDPPQTVIDEVNHHFVTTALITNFTIEACTVTIQLADSNIPSEAWVEWTSSFSLLPGESFDVPFVLDYTKLDPGKAYYFTFIVIGAPLAIQSQAVMADPYYSVTVSFTAPGAPHNNLFLPLVIN